MSTPGNESGPCQGRHSQDAYATEFTPSGAERKAAPPDGAVWITLSDVRESLRRRPKYMKIDKDGWLILTPPVYAESGSSYDIAPDRIDTFAKCFEWCFHLSKKTWMTSGMAKDLVTLLGEHLRRIKAEWPHA